jgi:hypothetical protein
MTATEIPQEVDSDLETARMRDEAFRALRAAMPPANLASALTCSARLKAALPDPWRLDANLVLVAYGGGKDSSYTLAFVRAMQLILFRVYGSTFRLRVATNRHAGMPHAVMENVDREYQALRLTGDPDCELLLIDGNEVTPFDVDAPPNADVMRRNRLDILMTGHRTFADGRPTFCNACNLSVFNSFGVAAAYGDGADLIITGDSPQEQRQYTAWLSRLARQLAPATPSGPVIPVATSQSGFGRLLGHLDTIGQSYFSDIYGLDAADALAERRVTSGVPPRLEFFSIYADTRYDAGDHMEMLTGFLGFEFDDFAFSFTESDCGNPALMAHLRGLKCERVYQRTYADGLAEYTEFALELMTKKDFPPALIEQMRARYEGPEAITRMRGAADDYAMTTFGLAETQLVCMVYSPFAEKGAGLEEFLRREHPALVSRAAGFLALLADEPGADPAGAAELERISGLELAQLRVLYRSPLRRVGGADVIDAVLADDPHKAIIRTRQTPNGPAILEQISGR